MTLRKFLSSLALSAAFAFPALAENWSQWRGPALNGSTTETNLPDSLDPQKNLVWSINLPGRGAGTPIIHGDRIFVPTYTADQKLAALCINRKDGTILWQKTMADAYVASKGQADLASPSPITDGTLVWFYFGTGDLACFDMEGNPKWSRNIQRDHGQWNYQWIYGSSPLLYKGKLYVQVLHRDVPVGRGGGGGNAQKSPSYLLAIDPTTGKDLWKHVRPEEAAAESKEAYGTPIPTMNAERDELIIVGGDVVTGHDPETGKEYWRGGHWNPEKVGHWRLVPSAVIADGLVIAAAPKKGPMFAFKPGGNGEINDTHLAWKTSDVTTDVPVPLYYQGNLYVVEDARHELVCVDPKTGARKWTQKLDRAVYRASPSGGDGKIYFQSDTGKTYVCSANEPKILSQSDLTGPAKAHASIALSQGQAFVRTGDKLYCFGKK